MVKFVCYATSDFKSFIVGIGFSGISDPGNRTGNGSGTRVTVRFFGISLYVSNNAVCEK
jgi:hypothetical protein